MLPDAIHEREAHSASGRVFGRLWDVPVLRAIVGQLEVIHATTAGHVLGVPLRESFQIRRRVWRVIGQALTNANRILNVLVI